MTVIHNLGFPRIGARRELKFACEAYWRGELDREQLLHKAAAVREANWRLQLKAGVSLLPVGDFSLYDHVLDTSFLLGHIPERAQADEPVADWSLELDTYFRVARGTASERGAGCCGVAAAEMTKWFDTNYHYLVPELSQNTRFSLNPGKLLAEVGHAKRLADNVKPVIIGPLTYLWLAKSDGPDKLTFIEQLIPVYRELLTRLAAAGVEWVQVDEPILALDLPAEWQQAFERAYHQLQTQGLNLLLASYFGELGDNLGLAARLPVNGLHLDLLRGANDLDRLLDRLSPHKVLSLGVVDGRNIWKSDLNATLSVLQPVSEQLGDRLWLAPSCSLLHVPVDLELEGKLNPSHRRWLAFARQKLEELAILQQALDGEQPAKNALIKNAADIDHRRRSPEVIRPQVRERWQAVRDKTAQRAAPYIDRAVQQKKRLNLPPLPTTTIGSFPQTSEIRQARRQLRSGELNREQYDQFIKQEIERAIRLQEQLGLDVLVHGEAERNDMVEYFGQQLDGFLFTANGWVQSYGSRCVKPPIIYGDVARPAPMTVGWAQYAQSLTDKPVKGMLTGPITVLQWSFVRDDQPRSDTAGQIALALQDEVADLERAGIDIIQVDEPALREGLPLRRKDWRDYLDWSTNAFRLATAVVEPGTQIHTHMCYAEFNDIIADIAALDADVITIETSRSQMELLDAFRDFAYPNEIGPGVYDIHSPNIPDQSELRALLRKALQVIPAQRLWVNPDCGLKTRRWNEVLPALENMVLVTQALRRELPALETGVQTA